MRVDPKCLPHLIQEELFLLKEEMPIVEPIPVKPEEKSPATKMLVVVDSLESANKALETDSFLRKVLEAVQVDVNEVQIQSPEEFREGSLAEFKWALFFGVQDLFQTPSSHIRS